MSTILQRGADLICDLQDENERLKKERETLLASHKALVSALKLALKYVSIEGTQDECEECESALAQAEKVAK